ncbi:MAG: hypothetical protein JW908_12320 [Anaerolineales bacterium]|nr:hypothetical protein [Anaerolineales bacterium]
MSNTNSILLRTLGAILLIVIILVGGAAAFMAGQAQGYNLAANTASGSSAAIESGAAASPAAWNPFWGRIGFFPFVGCGGIVSFLVMGFIFLFLLKILFFPFHRRFFHGDYPRSHWHRHPYWYGPWCEEPKTEKPEKPSEEANN